MILLFKQELLILYVSEPYTQTIKMYLKILAGQREIRIILKYINISKNNNDNKTLLTKW